MNDHIAIGHIGPGHGRHDRKHFRLKHVMIGSDLISGAGTGSIKGLYLLSLVSLLTCIT